MTRHAQVVNARRGDVEVDRLIRVGSGRTRHDIAQRIKNRHGWVDHANVGAGDRCRPRNAQAHEAQARFKSIEIDIGDRSKDTLSGNSEAVQRQVSRGGECAAGFVGAVAEIIGRS